MGKHRDEALRSLIELSQKQGYVSFDDITDSSEKWALPIQDVDWLSGSITSRGILIKEDAAPDTIVSDEDDYIDFAHNDYDEIFNRVLELDVSLKLFIEGIKTIRPPQWRETAQLKYQVIEGNAYARKRMIEMHLRLAVKIALQRTEEYDFDICDAIGYACIGLITAVDHYDPDNNGAFSSYSALWIQQVLNREMPTKRAEIYYPVHIKEMCFTAYPMMKRHGCFECDKYWCCNKLRKMIIDKAKCTAKQAEDVKKSCIPFESINAQLKNENTIDTQDGTDFEKKYCIQNENEDEIIIAKELHNQIDELLYELKPRERDVIIDRFGLGDSSEKTLEEVGSNFGVTRERIRQIEAKALRKLRTPKRSAKLRDFL